MIKNILIYLAILSSAFIFNIFYYAWFSWFLLVLTICIPFVSLVFSLPFMISCAVNGIVVFSHEKINIGDDFVLGISSKRKHSILCPQMRINIKTVNSFAPINANLLPSGAFKNAVYGEIEFDMQIQVSGNSVKIWAGKVGADFSKLQTWRYRLWTHD